MITHILSAALAASSPVAICGVHDGDSVRLCPDAAGRSERLRLINIDAPELAGSPRCSPQSRRRLAGSRNPAWCDHALALRSRDALARFLASGPVTIRRRAVDGYGRTLATLSVGGRDAGAMLVRLGLARRWR